jgi:hypothetical protein
MSSSYNFSRSKLNTISLNVSSVRPQFFKLTLLMKFADLIPEVSDFTYSFLRYYD